MAPSTRSSTDTSKADLSPGRLDHASLTNTALVLALRAFTRHRIEHGLPSHPVDAIDWARTEIWKPLVDGLDAVKSKVIRKSVLVPIAGVITLGFNPVFLPQLIEDKGWLIDSIKTANDYIAQNGVGRAALNLIQSVCAHPILLESNTLINSNRPALVNLASWVGGIAQMGFLGYPVVSAFTHVLSAHNAKERRRQGKEPLPATSAPELTVIGPSEFSDALLQNRKPHKPDLKRPVVMVHPDEGIPRAFKEGRVDYHIDVSSAVGRFTSLVHMQEYGLDARQVIFVGFNPTKAVFYGNKACGAITPSTCSTFLNMIANEDNPRTQRVVAIVPKDASLLANTTKFSELLGKDKPLMKRLLAKGVSVDLIHPEDLVLKALEPKILEIKARLASQPKNGNCLNICLIGDDDVFALKNFAKALNEFIPNLKISILAEGVLGEVEGRNFERLSDAGRLEEKQKLLAASHLNIVYGHDDSSTTDLCTVTVHDDSKPAGVDIEEKKQTICLMETALGAQDAKGLGFSFIPIHELLRDEVQRCLNAPKRSKKAPASQYVGT